MTTVPAATSAKFPAHFKPLPADIQPERASRELVSMYIQRAIDRGDTRQSIAFKSGMEANYLSMLKTGDPLPLGRVLPLAIGCGLSDEERFELLTTRILELHGAKVELDAHALASWVQDLCTPTASEAMLLQIWREESEPASQHLHGLLARPDVTARVRAVLREVAQQEMLALSRD